MNAHSTAKAVEHLSDAIRSSRAEKTSASRARDYLPAGEIDSELLALIAFQAQLERRLGSLRERIRGGLRMGATT